MGPAEPALGLSALASPSSPTGAGPGTGRREIGRRGRGARERRRPYPCVVKAGPAGASALRSTRGRLRALRAPAHVDYVDRVTYVHTRPHPRAAPPGTRRSRACAG